MRPMGTAGPSRSTATGSFRLPGGPRTPTTGPTMIARLLAASALLLVVGAPPAQAQEGSSPEICGSEAAEFMQELDGVWSVKQGAGRAIGTATVPFRETSGSVRGMIPMMLQEQDAVDLKLEYLPNFGFSVLSGQGQEMMMVPADRERALEEIQHQQEQGGEGTYGGGPRCADGTLPVLVGTNDYQLVDASGQEVEYVESSVPLIHTRARCSNDPLFQVLNAAFDPFRTDAGRAADTRSQTSMDLRECDIPPLQSGMMRMTIVVEFESWNSGSGYLYFDGEMGDIGFGAIADLTLSR